MSDLIIGTAILDDTVVPQRLYCVCKRDPDRNYYNDLPVHRKGTPKTSECEWEYEEHVDSLSVTPSVRMTRGEIEIFHNEGSWTVKFIREHSDEVYQRLRSINGISELT